MWGDAAALEDEDDAVIGDEVLTKGDVVAKVSVGEVINGEIRRSVVLIGGGLDPEPSRVRC
jgi:hypothetical protein